jgi:glyoxylase-like metal-dependent hydrolase (beta-lactamase superfamily II)
MLRQVAEGVLVHQSELLQNNTVVVQGRAGVLLIDPGITGDEMACLANVIRELDQPVVAGFATHPDWDHVLWHATLGCAARVVQSGAGRSGRSSALARGTADPISAHLDEQTGQLSWVGDHCVVRCCQRSVRPPMFQTGRLLGGNLLL